MRQPENPKDGKSRIYAEPNPTGSNPFKPTQHQKNRFPLAIHGFSVVDLRDHQQWVAGLDSHQAVFDGQLYRFADARQRAIFAAAPQRYAPALGGDCIVTFAETGRRAPGDLYYGVKHQQRLFFFAGPEQRDQFRANPEHYVDADLAHQGTCIVSKIDQQLAVKGLPETVATVGGLRYFFLGAKQQTQFIMNLRRYGAEIIIASEKDSPQSKQNHPPGPNESELSADGSKMKDELPRGSGDEMPSGADGALADSKAALAGYCPISIRDNGTWEEGDPLHRVEYDGKVYHFVGETEKALFAKNPTPYIPALAGDCPVSFVESNKRIPGNILHMTNFEGRLFMFAGLEEKKTFEASPSTFANVDLAVDGHCVVTLREKEETVSGLPEHMTWHRGKRYFFASEELKEKFLADPESFPEPGIIKPDSAEPESVEQE